VQRSRQLPLSAAKGKSSYRHEKNPEVASREHPRQDISVHEFLEKGQSKNLGETSNLLIFDLPPFFLHLGNFLLSSPGLFFFSSLSLIIFSLPSNTVFVSRTPKRQVRDPTGVIAGSLRPSYLQRSAQAQSSPPKLTLTGVPESSFRQRSAPQQLR
jgi:hypothetical protein